MQQWAQWAVVMGVSAQRQRQTAIKVWAMIFPWFAHHNFAV
jgi:hypothetical protein